MGTVTIGAVPRTPVSEIENSIITNPKVLLERMSVLAIQNQRLGADQRMERVKVTRKEKVGTGV